jgi:RNA polymerase sigma-70 factor (ECF subfamily)
MSSDEINRGKRSSRPSIGDFDSVYQQYGAQVYRFCFHLCGNASDAEDLTQEVFLAAYTGLDRFEGRSSVSTWLYRIALYRRQKMAARQRPETCPLEEEGDTRTASDLARASLDRTSLEQALAELSDPLREAFLLVKVEGLKLREAAEVLGIPQGTVKSRLHEALRKLRIALTEEDRTPPKREPSLGGLPKRKEAGDGV